MTDEMKPEDWKALLVAGGKTEEEADALVKVILQKKPAELDIKTALDFVEKYKCSTKFDSLDACLAAGHSKGECATLMAKHQEEPAAPPTTPATGLSPEEVGKMVQEGIAGFRLETTRDGLLTKLQEYLPGYELPENVSSLDLASQISFLKPLLQEAAKVVVPKVKMQASPIDNGKVDKTLTGLFGNDSKQFIKELGL